MALDLAILDLSGRPLRQVSIGLDAHARLVNIIEGEEFPLLARMADYYADAEYDSRELQQLLGEVEKISSRIEGDAALTDFFIGLLDLATLALSHEKPIVVLAD